MTINELIELLPEENRAAFRRSYTLQGAKRGWDLRTPERCPHACLNASLTYAQTPEGKEYWRNVYIRLMVKFSIPMSDYCYQHFSPPIADRMLVYLNPTYPINKFSPREEVFYTFAWGATTEGYAYWCALSAQCSREDR